MGSFLQESAWGEFQSHLGREVTTKTGENWKFQAILEAGTLNTRLYTPYGPEAESPHAMMEALDELEQLGRKKDVTFVRVEPRDHVTAETLKSLGYKKVTFNQLQPEHTQIIDLSPSEDEIIAQMSQNTRNLYRNYHKKGVEVHTSTNPEDIEIFLQFIHKVAERNHITPHSDAYFRTQADTLFPAGAATLFYATHEGTPIAAAIMYDSDDTRYYAHAAADDAYRKLSAGTSLLAYAIIDAKRAGKKYVDLYGIAPDDSPTHPWAGFTKFKKSFGGHEATYLGAWDKPLKPLQYLLYRTYQSIKR